MCRLAFKKHLQRLAAFAAALILCLSFAGAGELLGAENPAEPDLKVTCGGELIEFDPPVIVRNEYVFFPTEELLSALGADFEWDSETATAIGRKNGNSVEYNIGQAEYKANGVAFEFEEEMIPFVENERIYVTLDFIAEALGFVTEWDEETNTINITEITISFPWAEITERKDAYVSLEVQITPDWLKAEFFSSDENVATVNEDGLMYAKNAGQTVITAVLPNGLTAECAVTITVPVRGVDITISHNAYKIGESGTLAVKIYPEDATDKSYTIVSENPNVVKVAADGSFKCLTPGESDITITAANGISSTVKIYVSDTQVKKIEAALSRYLYKKGESGKMAVTVSPEDASDKSYTITSQNTGIVKVKQDGSFECLSAGESLITVKAKNGVVSTFTITVIDTQAFATEALKLINAEREKKGIAALTGDNKKLTAAAKLRAVELTKSDSYTRPNGKSWSSVLDDAEISRKTSAEAHVYDYTTPKAMVNMMLNKDESKELSLDPRMRELGIGIEIDEKGSIFWVLLFIG